MSVTSFNALHLHQMIKIGSMKAIFNKIKFGIYTAFIILEDALSMKHAFVDLGVG